LFQPPNHWLPVHSGEESIRQPSRGTSILLPLALLYDGAQFGSICGARLQRAGGRLGTLQTCPTNHSSRFTHGHIVGSLSGNCSAIKWSLTNRKPASPKNTGHWLQGPLSGPPSESSHLSVLCGTAQSERFCPRGQ